GGEGEVRGEVRLLRVSARPERERRLRGRADRRQSGSGELSHREHPRRSHPGEFLPFARRNSVKTEESRTMTKHINRRLFLRGLGGAVVAAPFLSSVAERQAKAQGLPAAGPPKRLLVMFTHYGCITTKFFPAN